MKKIKKIVCFAMCILLCIVSMSANVFAHSGRTDSSGGHNDNKNKSGLGGYHYHCGGYPAHLHDGGYCPYTDVMPSSVSVSAKKTTLGIGEKTTIDASVSPSNACDTSVFWENSNPDVVKLEDGTIEAVGYGTATLTATTFNGRKTSVTITVKEIVAEKVTIQETLDTLEIGETYELHADILPENVDNPTITWKSSDEAIATVDSEGKVEALAAGTVTISANASNGVNDTRTIEVVEVIAEKIEIELDKTIIHGDTAIANVIFYPENTTFQEIEWEVDNKDVIKIDVNGKVEALTVGKAKITAKQKDTSASFEIEVIPRAVESIIITSTIEEKLYVGDTVQFTAEVVPENATYPQVYWEVEDTEIATIDENGNLEAKATGKTIVKAYTEDGCTETYEIEVKMPPQMIAIPSGVVLIGAGIIMKKRNKKKKEEMVVEEEK